MPSSQSVTLGGIVGEERAVSPTIAVSSLYSIVCYIPRIGWFGHAGRVVMAKKSSIMKGHANLFRFYRVKGEIAVNTFGGTRVLFYVRVR